MEIGSIVAFAPLEPVVTPFLAVSVVVIMKLNEMKIVFNLFLFLDFSGKKMAHLT